jgi:hypothetical protein
MDQPIKQIVLFSHGFGVAKDSKGLFTDIAAALGPNIFPVMFDYNDFNDEARTMTIKPFSQQVAIFNQQLQLLRRDHPGVPISVVAHSQGCIIAALAKPAGLDRVILLAPGETFNIKRMERSFTERLKPERLPDGTVKLSRRDGSSILIPPDYEPELRPVDPPEEYNDLATRSRVTLIRAAQDDILGRHVDDSRLSEAITIVSVDGDHNFNGEARPKLVETVKRLLTVSLS